MADPVIHPNGLADPILSRKAVAQHLGVSIATLFRLCRDGRLPKPIRISTNRVGWKRSTIERFIAEREAA